MRFVLLPGLKHSQERENRRRCGRLPQDTLSCNLGTVLDISATGMRVLGVRVPGHGVKVKIRGVRFPQTLRAKVTWSKRLGLFRHEVGLEFLDVSPETAKVLTAIAIDGRKRRAI
jgi:hypothetical protein